ncbi:MAG: DUF1820 family protein [Acidobacteriota bacterium]
MPEPRRLYKVTYVNQGRVYEIFARQVSQGGLLGFIEVEELVFGETTKVVVDPAEERLQKEFDGVKRSYLPMHSILRIDEVEKEGVSRVADGPDGDSKGETGKITPFPMPIFTPGGDRS